MSVRENEHAEDSAREARVPWLVNGNLMAKFAEPPQAGDIAVARDPLIFMPSPNGKDSIFWNTLPYAAEYIDELPILVQYAYLPQTGLAMNYHEAVKKIRAKSGRLVIARTMPVQ